MKAESLKICGVCKEVFRAKQYRRNLVPAVGRNAALQRVVACPCCNSLNVMPLPAVVRSSSFFKEASRL